MCFAIFGKNFSPKMAAIFGENFCQNGKYSFLRYPVGSSDFDEIFYLAQGSKE